MGASSAKHALTTQLCTTLALLLDLSHRSLSSLTKRSATQSLGLTSDGQIAFTSPLSFSSPEVQHTCYSPNGKLQAVFRSIAAKEGKGARKIVEVWSVQEGVKLEELEVTEEHGDWYFDGECNSKRSTESYS